MNKGIGYSTQITNDSPRLKITTVKKGHRHSDNFIKMNNGSDQSPMMIEINYDNSEEAPDFNFSNRDLEKI